MQTIVCVKGGDKLTLNLSGTTSPLTVQTTLPLTNNSNHISSLSPRGFSPTSPGYRNNFNSLPSPIEPTPVFASESNQSKNQNGGGSSTPPLNDSVTVTHFSEQRGGMEKISVPAPNVMSTELKSPKMDNTLRAAVSNGTAGFGGVQKMNGDSEKLKNLNNPFLNMSNPTSPILKISSTNPFREQSPVAPPISPNSIGGDTPSTTDTDENDSVHQKSPLSPTFIPKNPFRDTSNGGGGLLSSPIATRFTYKKDNNERATSPMIVDSTPSSPVEKTIPYNEEIEIQVRMFVFN